MSRSGHGPLATYAKAAQRDYNAPAGATMEMGRMRRSVMMIIAGLFLSGSVSGGALAQEVGVKERGLTLATRVCSACHAIGANDPVANTAPPSFTAVAEARGMSEVAIGVLLRTPHLTMPDLILSPTEIRDVAAYIMSLKATR